ncbi:MAG: hypothetical protein ACE5F1_11885 [Planctomycetota bacterium]
MNDRLAGTWKKIQGTGRLPDEFSLTPADPVSGIYRAGSLTLAYSLEENCQGILLIDANQTSIRPGGSSSRGKGSSSPDPGARPRRSSTWLDRRPAAMWR